MNVALRKIAPAAERPQKWEALADALFKPMGVAGVYARTDLYEQVIEGAGELREERSMAGRA